MIKNKQITNSLQQGYSGTIELIHTKTNIEIIKWTEYFSALLVESRAFDLIRLKYEGSVRKAKVIAESWYAFSSFMPWFLCQAAAMVSNNLLRHYIIQTAFEELGLRDHREIHPEMFWKSAETIGINELPTIEDFNIELIEKILSGLKETLLGYTSDSKIMGVLLGLEIPAEENIEIIFNGLGYDNQQLEKLENEKFFKLHREIELEHVRLTVANFIKFCQTEKQKSEFIEGFNDGVEFWRSYWSVVSKFI